MKNPLFIRTLVFALLVIWGSIAYKIVLAVAGENADEEPVPVAQRPAAVVDSIRYVYRSDVRDPFALSGAVKRDTARSHAKPPVLWTPPPLRLTGILSARSKRTAMVQTVEGGTVFLQEGDTLRGTKVLKIEPLKVSYLYMKKRNEWLLERP